MTDDTPWLAPLRDAVAARPAGATLALLADYRPDLARQMAHALGLGFVDCRQAWLSALGWQAHTLGLETLTERLREAMDAEGRGLVALNSEALLATKPAAERRAWLAGLPARTWPAPLVLPLTVYADEAPEVAGVCDLRGMALPEQSFLNRLAF